MGRCCAWFKRRHQPGIWYKGAIAILRQQFAKAESRMGQPFCRSPFEVRTVHCQRRRTLEVFEISLQYHFPSNFWSAPRQGGESDQNSATISDADILGGLHGAGLGHAVFLQPGSALFEMKDKNHWASTVYLNMANLNDVGYYAYDTRPMEDHDKRGRFLLTPLAIDTLVESLWQAWQDSQNENTQVSKSSPTHCEFPFQHLHASVSSFNTSKCYLVLSNDGRWMQTTTTSTIKNSAKIS